MEAPAAVGPGSELQAEVVDEVVVVAAEQDQVVDIGGPPAWWLPGHDVVGFALGGVCVTDAASSVAGYECSPLAVGGEAGFAADPEGIAVCGQDQREQI